MSSVQKVGRAALGRPKRSLVALDTSTLSALQRQAESAPEEFEMFLAEWECLQATMVLTIPYAREIAQLPDEGITRRVAVISRFREILFLPVWEDPLAADEIRAQLLRHTFDILKVPQPPGAPLYGEFVTREAAEVDSEAILALVNFAKEEARREAPIIHEQMQSSWRMRRDLRRAQDKARAETVPFSKEEQDARRAARRREMLDAAEKYPAVQEFLRRSAAAEDAVRERGGSRRQQKLAKIGLKGVPWMERAPENDWVVLLAIFPIITAEVAPAFVARFGESVFKEALARFDPYDAPGISVRCAVERNRLSSGDEADGSSYLDAAIVMCAPYLDVTFVDRRTMHYFNRSLERHPNLLPRARETRLARFTTLSHVLDVVREARAGL